ncbi:MAG: hypothetical protein Q9219_007153 [cf. Caloplaca sp. 3 TL-2023]
MDPIYEPIPRKREVDISYQPLTGLSPNPGGHHHVIGASVWCPGGNCNAESTAHSAIRRAQELDRQDHDLNGALQFVAKFLEVWFMFVATGLVYDLATLLARSGRGLPLGYLMNHLEFTDLRYLFNPLLWKSPSPNRHSTPEKRARMMKLYTLAVATALLTILVNLMGPATAVLVLPTLQWVNTPYVFYTRFGRTGVMDRPQGDDVLLGCSESQLDARNYSCTSDVFGPSLDAWAAQSKASIKQNVTILGTSQENALQFTFNATGGELMWIPNRQVLGEMSHDFLQARGDYASDGEYPDSRYNNSLQTVLQRQGPSLGVQANCYAGTITQLELDDDRFVRCYTGWTLDYSANYTKCLRFGTGFNDTNYYAQFDLEIEDPDVPDYESGVGVYFADKATYYNDTDDFGSGVKSCLTNDTSIKCDWDRVFDGANLPPELKNTSLNVGVISYQVPGIKDTDSRVWCDHVTYQSFPTYSADTSRRSNAQSLVTLNGLPESENGTTPQVVSPHWFLAAWSVDEEGMLDGNRQIVKELIRLLPFYLNINESRPDELSEQAEFLMLHTYVLGQSMSMINYYSYGTAPIDPYSDDGKKAEMDRNIHPVFHTWATLHVWAYGLSGRTAKLGVVVVALGSLCVLARFLLGFRTGITGNSTVETLAAAFEHRHQGEFEGLEEEEDLAQVRYRVLQDGEGRRRFLPEKRGVRWNEAGGL